jgi:hypothetical protein
MRRLKARQIGGKPGDVGVEEKDRTPHARADRVECRIDRGVVCEDKIVRSVALEELGERDRLSGRERRCEQQGRRKADDAPAKCGSGFREARRVARPPRCFVQLISHSPIGKEKPDKVLIV